MQDIGRMDAFDGDLGIIYELKPNTAWSIAKGGSQLIRYADGVVEQKKLLEETMDIIKILVVYN